MTVGILHPGEMGAALAACLTGKGVWVGEGRSGATRRRAEEAGLEDIGSLQAAVEGCEALISICPPSVAVELGQSVSDLGFDGIYVDANAISPATARRIGSRFDRFVDGSVIGPPPSRPDDTRLYLSGAEAEVVAGLFWRPKLETVVLGELPGSASALKMAYAAWTKGTSALLLAIAAMAHGDGVLPDLLGEWARSIPELPDRLGATSARIGRKAWRFEGEMHEIAAAFDDAGLPSGFHVASAQIFGSLRSLREDRGQLSIEDVVSLIRDGRSGPA